MRKTLIAAVAAIAAVMLVPAATPSEAKGGHHGGGVKSFGGGGKSFGGGSKSFGAYKFKGGGGGGYKLYTARPYYRSRGWGYGVGVLPLYGGYYYYGGGCGYYYQMWQETGSRYWGMRYYDCID